MKHKLTNDSTPSIEPQRKRRKSRQRLIVTAPVATSHHPPSQAQNKQLFVKEITAHATKLISIAQVIGIGNGDVNIHKFHEYVKQINLNNFDNIYVKIQPFINDINNILKLKNVKLFMKIHTQLSNSNKLKNLDVHFNNESKCIELYNGYPIQII